MELKLRKGKQRLIADFSGRQIISNRSEVSQLAYYFSIDSRLSGLVGKYIFPDNPQK
jgi:hypothetical protein